MKKLTLVLLPLLALTAWANDEPKSFPERTCKDFLAWDNPQELDIDKGRYKRLCERALLEMSIRHDAPHRVTVHIATGRKSYFGTHLEENFYENYDIYIKELRPEFFLAGLVQTLRYHQSISDLPDKGLEQMIGRIVRWERKHFYYRDSKRINK